MNAYLETLVSIFCLFVQATPVNLSIVYMEKP